nr:MAG TPA: hypothetical protein [Caudoviricetes sp.]
MMFRYHHLLPDEVGRQSPFVLFNMLDSLSEEQAPEQEYEGDDPYLKMFYGK